MNIKFYGHLAEQLGTSRLLMNIKAKTTIYEMLLCLNNNFPNIFNKYFEFSAGSLKTTLVILVNGTSINNINIIEECVDEKDEVYIMPMLEGG